MTVFETLYRGGWTLLCFDEPRIRGKSIEVTEVGQLGRMYSEISILHLRTTRTADHGSNDYLDIEQYARKAYKLRTSEGLILVRPDGYIGFSSHRHDVKALAVYCQRWLV